MTKTVLISGAGVAGPALAYWLHRYGFEPTVVERAPAPRAGGQAIDVRGVALDVVDRMGVLDQVRAAKTGMRGMSIVDADGTELMSTTEETLTGGRTDSGDVELMRDELAEILRSAATADYRYGDTITALTQDDDGVHVTFENSEARRFDLVIGADGPHSRVRSLTFGEEARFSHHLDVYLAIFTMDNHLGLRDWQTMHRTEDSMAMIYNARQGTVTRGMLGFESAPLDFDYRDLDAQRRILADRYPEAGWEIPRMLKAMWEAPDFYFDAMSQIKMDTWSDGRIALVGDAGYCASPLSGQGTSLALVGAYVLAGELAAAGGDHRVAFAEYERVLRPFVDLNQRLATDTPKEQPAPEKLAAAANGITLKDYS
jgi:2-polyprenyl-6-methoxyphenol hydroxylase-like FAD-dependent oxidoreductase